VDTQLDQRFSDKDAQPVDWETGQQRIEEAQIYWISTVRSDGRPHVTPLIALWQDGALYFCTGPDEQKGVNLASNPCCAITTGSNEYDHGLDVVVEGRAERVTDEDRLRELADAYVSKYGEEWRFGVEDGAFTHSGAESRAHVFEVKPAKVLGFGKGDTFSQTRWTP
jgi:nitroimidazol reductase NimA-like FMN-containing flavoprotein (pyridoxamine 5'-phosphate oxidase superfamily)